MSSEKKKRIKAWWWRSVVAAVVVVVEGNSFQMRCKARMSDYIPWDITSTFRVEFRSALEV